MNIDTFDLQQGVLALFFASVLHIILLRRTVHTVFDPVIYMAIATTFALAITYALNGNGPLTWRTVLSITLFWLAWRWTVLKRENKSVPDITGEMAHEQIHGRLLRVLVVLSSLYVAANVYLWLNSGIPALAESADLAKSEGYSGGLGFVRRINWGAGSFLVFGLTLRLLQGRNRRRIALYVVVLVITALSGSKAALLPALFSLALISSHKSVYLSRKALRSVQHLLYGLTLIAMAVGVALLSAGDDADASTRLNALVIRLFYFGDVMLYWSDPQIRIHFANHDALTYISHVLNPILGMFRLAEYETPLGNQMVQHALSVNSELSESLGPNTPFYVSGELFFGPWIGPLYAGILGWLIARIRNAFSASVVRHPLRFCLWGTLAVMTPALATEESLFVSMVSDMLFVVLLVIATCEILMPPMLRSPDGIWNKV